MTEYDAGYAAISFCALNSSRLKIHRQSCLKQVVCEFVPDKKKLAMAIGGKRFLYLCFVFVFFSKITWR